MVRKFLLLIIALILTGIIYAQIPKSFNYQAVIRTASGELVSDQDISISLSILEGTETGSSIYTETHSVESNSYGMISLKVGEGTPSGAVFSDINWTSEAKFIKVEADITGKTNYTHIGTSELVSVPFAEYSNKATNSDTANIAMKLGSKNVYTTNADTLFVVKDQNGNAVFAVFPDGVKVIVDQTAKGNVGGFAVSGRNPGKAGDISIFSVTPDSTRVYVNNLAKGNVGGFAVSGRNPAKGITEDIFTVNSDSTRVYINNEAKGNVGGFAVSGRNPGKGIKEDVFTINSDSRGMKFFADLDKTESKTFTIQAETGFVGIGKFTPTSALDVSGAINFSGSLLQNGEVYFPDFVFENDYQLETIEEHADFMWNNKHLPAILSAKEINEVGSYDVIQRREQILEELEKAHIYIDQLNNRIKRLNAKNIELEEKLDEILNLLENN